jgi:ribosomal protein S27AE
MHDRIDCPECGDPVRIGLPRDAEVESVSTEGDPAPEPETVRAATPTCSTCGSFVVTYETDPGGESPSGFGDGADD